MMKAVIDIKSKLKSLIEEETNLQVLQAIKTLLEKPSIDPVLKDKLTSRALKANEDIKSGRVYTRQEAEAKLRDRLGI